MKNTDFRWQLFLKDLAVEVSMTTREIEVFTYQFDRQREHRSVSEIKQSIYTDKFIGGENYKNISSNVYAKLSDLGLDVESTNGKHADVTWQWLKGRYPQWEEQLLGRSKLGIDTLWAKLKELGKYAPERMGMYIVGNEIDKAGAGCNSSSPKLFLDLVPKGTQGLKFKILSEKMGHVLLLNRDEANVVYCLCPSKFAPSVNLHRGEKIVPSESDYAYLGAEMIGKEEWWGWIVDRVPPLSWLDDAARNEDLQLKAEQLTELLSQVELQKGEVLHTFYRVS
jgi:hypothetical protein